MTISHIFVFIIIIFIDISLFMFYFLLIIRLLLYECVSYSYNTKLLSINNRFSLDKLGIFLFI